MRPLLFILITLTVSAQNKTGVLVLAHGGNENWNKTVNEAVSPLKEKYEVEVAFGMADPNTMQEGIDNLESKGVNEIVAVQLFISSYSPIIRQNEYLLGLRDELADEPMLMDHSGVNHGSHSHGSHHSNHHSAKKEKVELKPLKFNSKIYLTEPLNDHPLVAEILSERIGELSKNPEDETLILVAHGPNDEEDNTNWIAALESLADQLRAKKDFKNIFSVTVRDDAPEEIYEMAKENLRSLVRQSSKDGKTIVIPVLLSQGGIEKGIVERLEGLNYEWNGKTLLPHKNITEFIKQSVENALNNKEAKL